MLIQPVRPDRYIELFRELEMQVQAGGPDLEELARQFSTRHMLSQFGAWDKEQKAIGYADVSKLLHTTRGAIARIETVFVNEDLPETAREEAFLRLVRMCVRAAEMYACRLEATVSNEKLRDLYQWLGFTPVETRIMRRSNAILPEVLPQRSRVSYMRPSDFDHIRKDLLPFVSGGSFNVPAPMLQEFVEGGALLPLVVEQERVFLAYAELHMLLSGQCGLVGRIERVVTDPLARRQGLASAVVAELVCHGITRGVQRFELTVEDEGAIRVYERLGFEEVGSATLMRFEPVIS